MQHCEIFLLSGIDITYLDIYFLPALPAAPPMRTSHLAMGSNQKLINKNLSVLTSLKSLSVRKLLKLCFGQYLLSSACQALLSL